VARAPLRHQAGGAVIKEEANEIVVITVYTFYF
jgi:hypothetical protein